MKPYGIVPKRRRSGTGFPFPTKAVSVLAKRSPAKKSPFKRRAGPSAIGISSLALVSAPSIDSLAGDQSCNIRVAVRVRPENEREMSGSSR